MLLAIPYKEDSAQILARESMDACLNVVQNFHKICINDPEINFETPQNIGIGLSRGVACRLVSGNQTLDYSGKVVSLASKLMNIA